MQARRQPKASVPRGQPTETLKKVKVSGNGWRKKKEEMEEDGVGMMVGLGIGKKGGNPNPKGGTGKKRRIFHLCKKAGNHPYHPGAPEKLEEVPPAAGMQALQKAQAWIAPVAKLGQSPKGAGMAPGLHPPPQSELAQ